MSITQKLSGIISEAGKSISLSGKREKVNDYLRDHDLKAYFHDEDNSQRKYYGELLEKSINDTFDKHKPNIESVAARYGGIAGIAIAGIQSIDFVMGTPVGSSYYSSAALILLKTAMELPSVYRHITHGSDSKTAEGLGLYALRKIVALSIPVIGPLLDGNSLKYLVMKQVINESRDRFLEESERGERNLHEP